MFYWIKRLLGIGQMFGGVSRSPKWEEVRKSFLKENPRCATCGAKNSILKPLNVHHEIPFHKDHSLELKPSNLITLCRPHHLLIGHLMNWKSFNSIVRKDSAYFLDKILKRPR